MRCEWNTKKLNSVIDYVIDNRGRNPKQYTDYGIPVIDNYLITSEGKVNLSNTKRFIDDNTYNSFLRKYIKENDVLMTLVGNGYGKVAITPKEKCAIIQNTIGLRCNENNSNIFLYYLLNNSRELFMNLNRGAAQPSIKVGDVLGVQFEFPPLPTQKKIAHILSTLDDKIELNRKMNQTLEEMAQALFKSWFVNFDPVHAKAKCNSDEELEAVARELGISKEVLELFPSEFEESEMGMIPKGWEVKKFGDIVIPKKGKSITKKTIVEGNVPVVAGGLTPAYYHNQYNVKAPVITISASGANAGYVNLYNENIWASDCSYINGTNSNYIFTHYTYLTLMQSKITWMQQGAAQPHIYPSHLMRLEIVDAGEKLWNFLESKLSPMFDKIAINELEIKTLQKTRDTLLPKLLSGELDVSEIGIEGL